MNKHHHHHPPRLSEAILGWLLKDDWETPLGDFEEFYNDLAVTRGVLYARWWYRLQILTLFPGRLYEKLYWSIAMLKNYLTIAFRSLGRQKGFAAINIAGLAVGLACCLLIGVYVYHESTYDHYHQNADRIYRVLYNWQGSEEAPKPPMETFNAWGSAAAAPLLEQNFADVERAVRFSGGHKLLLGHETTSHVEENYFFADSTVFSVFDFNLIQGNPSTALTAPNTIVLTESAAKKYFGAQNPMNQTLLRDNEVPMTVTGIMKDLPPNTHFDIDVLISMVTFENEEPDYKLNWGYVDFFTYVLLREGDDLDALRAQMPAFTHRYLKTGDDPFEETLFIEFEPLKEAYLTAKNDHVVIGPQGNAANLRIFQLVGLFILIIACINYMNLSTARSMDRAREVGMRKVLGSERKRLIGQFLMESVVVALFAMALAFVLALLCAPLLNAFSGSYFPTYLLVHPAVIVLALALTLIVGLLAGSYPAFILSAFNPITVIKGAFKRTRQGIFFRKGLVLSQFSISLILLISTLVVFDQIQYMQNQRLGFVEEQQLVIDYGHDAQVNNQLESFIQTWEDHPDVIAASATRSVPGTYRPNASTFIEDVHGEMKKESFQIFEVDYGFIEQLGLEMAAGRSYSRAFPSDSSQALVISEAAIKLYGYTDPEEILGKRYAQWGNEGTVIGVVKDFHHQSLHREIAPLSLRLYPTSSQFFVLRLDTQNLQKTLADIEAIWNERVPHRPFLYNFLDETFAAQYKSEETFGALLGLFAGLALFVACLGLLGTAAYSAQQRTKEIGVRKVLGASVGDIVRLLSRDIITLICIAFVVSFPLAYVGLSRWLDSFPYHTSLNGFIFLGAGGALLLVTLLTISFQTIRAATAAPVKSMRYE